MKTIVLVFLALIFATVALAKDNCEISNEFIDKIVQCRLQASKTDAKFHDHLWLTPLLHEAILLHDSLSAEATDSINKYLITKKSENEQVYHYKHFSIHYVIDGTKNSIDGTDSDNNNIPDYVETIATIFGDEIDELLHVELSLMRPPFDADGYYHIYLTEMQQGILGYTQPVKMIGDNPSSKNIIEKNAYQSDIYLGNSYNQYDKPLIYLRNTIIHEYNHAIQFGYTYKMETWFMEMCATYAEGLGYPDDRTNHDYIGEFFYYPDVALNLEDNELFAPPRLMGHWYSTWVFAQFLFEQTSTNLLNLIYRDCDDLLIMANIDNKAKAYNQSFSELFDRFILACGLLPSNLQDESYSFIDGLAMDKSIKSMRGYIYEKSFNFTGSPLKYNTFDSGNHRLMRLSADYYEIGSTETPFDINLQELYTANNLKIILLGLNAPNQTFDIIEADYSNTIQVYNPDLYKNYILAVIRQNIDETTVISIRYELTISPKDNLAKTENDWIIDDLLNAQKAQNTKHTLLRLYDVTGRMIKDFQHSNSDNLIGINRGLYVLTYYDQTGLYTTKKIQIN